MSFPESFSLNFSVLPAWDDLTKIAYEHPATTAFTLSIVTIVAALGSALVKSRQGIQVDSQRETRWQREAMNNTTRNLNQLVIEGSQFAAD